MGNEIRNIFEKAKGYMAEASELIEKYFEKGFETRSKADTTLVTEADEAVEKLLRAHINRDFPDHSIIGEEEAASQGTSEYVWVLDPIDGTQSFVHGVPTFGSILAVWKGNECIVGVITHPALKEKYEAAKGLGCFINGKKHFIKLSGPLAPNDIITSCTKHQWNQTNNGATFEALWAKHRYIRIFYDCFALTRAIAGQTAAGIEVNVNWWDIAPMPVLMTEAGGECIDLWKKKTSEGKELHSMLFGRKEVVAQISKWIDETK